jgi:hypothetical protein
MRTKVGLIANSNHEIIIIKWQVQNKISIEFYCKNETTTKQSYDKKMYPKNSVEQIEGNGKNYCYLYPLGT